MFIKNLLIIKKMCYMYNKWMKGNKIQKRMTFRHSGRGYVFLEIKICHQIL
jgi:hypothetical protein